MLRAPTLSVSECERLSVLARVTNDDAVDFKFDQIDFKVQVAIAIESLSLFNRLSSGSILHSSDEMRKLLRYIKRMGWRATPFGAFTGIAFGKWDERTDIELTGERIGRARMDVEWITNYVRAMELIPVIRKSLLWFVAPEALISARPQKPCPGTLNLYSLPKCSE